MKTDPIISSGTALECRFLEACVGEETCRDSADASDLHCPGYAGSVWIKTVTSFGFKLVC